MFEVFAAREIAGSGFLSFIYLFTNSAGRWFESDALPPFPHINNFTLFLKHEIIFSAVFSVAWKVASVFSSTEWCSLKFFNIFLRISVIFFHAPCLQPFEIE